MKSKLILLLILLIMLAGCDYQHGLHPVEISGISGTVSFLGEWPDQIQAIRVVCSSQKFDADNIYDLLKIFDPNIKTKIGDPLPTEVQSYDYTLELDPGIYKWIVVIMSRKSSAFQVVGEYTGSDSLQIQANKVINHINITVDFNQVGLQNE